MKKPTRRQAEVALSLPTGVLTEASHMELCGNRRAMIEGCRGIVKYDEDVIELRVDNGTVRFTGRELCMTNLNPTCAVVTGRLLSLEFL
ncbi:MAG: YabP/YqfC family sporulation protein [Clostridia bacterium]|nr:YabP/YqfC family sporulation protein [Clostridia bacterium]